MMAPPIVETRRLVLTAPRVEDADAIMERYATDIDVTRYLSWPRHRTLADAQAFVAFSARQWEREGVGPYLIWARADGQLLGSTGLDLEPDRQAMTGYVLAKDAWGVGYATEVLASMVDVASDVGVWRIRAICHPDNEASQRVLAKCGFERDRSWDRRVVYPNLAPGVESDVLCYGRSLSRGVG